MKCQHPECTGVHDNNRYSELCPRSLDKKRDRDQQYSASAKGILRDIRLRGAEGGIRLESLRNELREIGQGIVATSSPRCQIPSARL